MNEELKAKFLTGKKLTQDILQELIDLAAQPGPKGEKGDTGAAGKTGAKGDTGAAGKDGFGTKAEYDALVARIEALEGTTPS